MKKNTDSPSTVALKIDRKRRGSNRLLSSATKMFGPRSGGMKRHIYTHTPRIWHHTPHAAGNSRRGGIQEITSFVAAQRELPSQEFERIGDLVVFRKGTGNRDIHGVVDDPCKSFGAEFGEGGGKGKGRDADATRRDAAWRCCVQREECSTLPGSIYKIIPRNGGNKSLESWEAFLIR